MKILHVITTLDRGGAENQLLILVKEQIRAGHIITVCGLKGSDELSSDFRQIGADVDPSLLNRSVLSQILRMRRILRQDFDVVHAHLPAAEVICAITKTGIPLIISKHNAEVMLSKMPVISRCLSRLVEFRSDYCITISETVKDFLLANGEWTCRETIETVYYGIPFSSNEPKVYPEQMTSLRFLTVARMVPQKNIPFLLRAFKMILEKHPSDTLTLVGDGIHLNTYMQLADALGIAGNTQFVGRTDDVTSNYLRSDVFVLSSDYEGFGLVVLEAGLLGLPIVARRISAIPEVLGIEYLGFPNHDNEKAFAEIMERCHDKDFWKQLQKAVESRIRKFNANEMQKNVENVYKKVLLNFH